MEILKRGKMNREYTCNVCECVFRFYARDVYVGIEKPYIICPECNETIYLNEEELWKKY